MPSLATWFTPSIQVISRSSGRSAVAASAYRACMLIYDERTGITHDFTPKAKNGLVKNICVGIRDNDIATFWNNAERAENRANSTVARELMLPLPDEWTDEQNEKCVLEIAQMLNENYGVGVQGSIHRPSRGSKNKHVHMMFSTRVIDEYNYPNGGFGKKTRILDDKKTNEISRLREAVADIVNIHARENGNDWFVTAGKYSEHIQDHVATHHISVNHGKNQKKYIDINRAEVKEARNEISKVQKQIDDIDEKVAKLTEVKEKQIEDEGSLGEYIDVFNKHGQAMELLDEIMKRAEVGHLTDFWEPDTQETLEQKLHATKDELEKLDKRKLELERILQANSTRIDYTPPEQVMVNKPSTINEYQYGEHDNPLTNAPSIINDGWSI